MAESNISVPGYEILSRIGGGRFGDVFRARKLSTGQEVAIKALSRQGSGAPLEKRLRQEIENCARLQHPNLVRLLGVGELSDGSPCAIFEHLKGQTLAQLLEKGPLPYPDALHLMSQTLDALVCLHRSGLIHCDIKPANLMVSHTGARPNAVLFDFGLSIDTSAEDSSAPWGKFLGTPSYAAPEQIRGERPGPESDLYSWALMLLECLSGKAVVEGSSRAEVSSQHLSKISVDLPEELKGTRLGRLLQRLTSPEIKDRQVHAAQLLAAMQEAAHHVLSGGSLDMLSTEQRVASVISCALQGGEGISEETRLAFEDLCAGSAVRHGGSLAAIVGFRVFLLFGLPRAKEDDAIRAARAALEIVAKSRASYEVRLGLHSGALSLFGRPLAQGLPGVVPDIALRLDMLAKPGSVVISDSTRSLLQERFATKGVLLREEDAWSQAFLLEEELAEERRAVGAPTLLPLIGRREELYQLQVAWEETLSGAGQTFFLQGEAGIGKSRLAQELRRQLGGGHLWLQCRCSEIDQNHPLAPFSALLSSLLQREGEEPKDALQRLLRRLQLDQPNHFALLASLVLPSDKRPPLDLPPDQQKAALLQRFVSLLKALAKEQPTVLLVEDLHWSDPTSRELLTQLVEQVPGHRLLLLLTARPELEAPWFGEKVHRLSLVHLREEEIKQALRASGATKNLSEDAVQQVLERSDGVPLFLEELLRSLQEEPSLKEQPTGKAAIPLRLQAVLSARLERLGRARETARLAATIGREINLGLLYAISPRPEEEVEEDLRQLVRAGLLLQSEEERAGYFFRHALLRDAAYLSQPESTRHAVHAQIAGCLEKEFPAEVEQRPDIMAYHLHSAKDSRACQFAVRAAQMALGRSANAEALAYATEALGWLDRIKGEDERAMTELDLNGTIQLSLMALEGYSSERLERLTKRSQELLFELEKRLKNHPQVFSTLWALSAYHSMRCNRVEILSLLQQGLILAEQMGNLGHQVATLSVLGQMTLFLGDSPEASKKDIPALEKSKLYLDKCLHIYNKESHRDLATIYGLDPCVTADVSLGHVTALRGSLDQALLHAKRAVTWAQEIEHVNSVAGAFLHLGIVHQYRRDSEQVKNLSNEMLQFTTKYNLAFYGAFAVFLRGWATRELEQSRLILEMMDKGGARLGLPYYRALIAETEFTLGNEDKAIQHIESSIEQAYKSNQFYYLAESYRLRGEFLQKRDPDAGRSDLARAIEVAQAQGANLLELRASTSLYHAAPDDNTRSQLHSIYQKFSEGLDCFDLIMARRLLFEQKPK